MNKVIMCGRLTADPEIRYGANNSAVARFNLAVDRRFKREGEPEADFFSCVEFGKAAEFAEKYLRKGIKIIVSGRIENNNYTNKDGQRVYSTQIVIEEQEFAESKNNSVSDTQADNSTPNTKNAVNGASAKSQDGFMNIPEGLDEELPFM